MSRRYDDNYDDYDNRGGDRRRRGRSGGNSNYRWRKERAREERTLELMTFAALVIIMAVALLGNLANGLTLCFIGGGILVGSGVLQSQRRMKVNPATWIGGAALLGIGFAAANGYMARPDAILPLLIMGAILVASFVTGEL